MAKNRKILTKNQSAGFTKNWWLRGCNENPIQGQTKNATNQSISHDSYTSQLTFSKQNPQIYIPCTPICLHIYLSYNLKAKQDEKYPTHLFKESSSESWLVVFNSNKRLFQITFYITSIPLPFHMCFLHFQEGSFFSSTQSRGGIEDATEPAKQFQVAFRHFLALELLLRRHVCLLQRCFFNFFSFPALCSQNIRTCIQPTRLIASFLSTPQKKPKRRLSLQVIWLQLIVSVMNEKLNRTPKLHKKTDSSSNAPPSPK